MKKMLKIFSEHGGAIKNDHRIQCCGFSKNDKKIMTLSSDGVVIIRNLKI